MMASNPPDAAEEIARPMFALEVIEDGAIQNARDGAAPAASDTTHVAATIKIADATRSGMSWGRIDLRNRLSPYAIKRVP
jgi:hypothetical protein